ncbi:hypothetical protein MANES_14G144500v8 [Manihot esculenta]|uniref:Uncharacterized protein n=1 Tax=Manihot esculenta TaxID=3983 RepID=A0ACB7GGT0_MANES|nr:hypothetical protein MANES_14G144500v8 [Manihot esculenta]
MNGRIRGSKAEAVMKAPSKDGNSFGEAIYGAGTDIIRTELGAYGEKLLCSSSAYVHGNGHWMRSTEKVGGELSYKPPIYDINAPDLYIPLMAFGTYLILAGFFLGINGKFSPEALSVQLTNGLLCWLFQVLILEATLHTLGDGDVPLLDVVAYGGYTFVAVSLAILARIACRYFFYTTTLWECFCMGMFFVKIMKRILIAEMRSCDKHSSKRHYLLLLVAIAQIPLLFWLGSVGL